MGGLKKALRVIGRVALVTVITLIVVPTLINMMTGGAVPSTLAPYARWLWPALAVLVVVVVVLEAWEPIVALFTPVDARRPHDPRNLHNALRQVLRYVQQRSHGTFAERVRVQVALEERPDAVLPPANLVQRVSGEETDVPSGTEIVEIFDNMQHLMLILGAPGAGKTTLLLDLASSLAGRAATTPVEQAPVIPVLVELAEWSSVQRLRRSILNARARRQARDFTVWLLNAVDRRYKIPSSVGRVWLEEGQLALLLDGLDEVHADSRERCVQEINKLQRLYPTLQVAVCCREGDYDELVGSLLLQGAVTIRPLTHSQVLDYFTAARSHGVEGINAALEDDPDLWELLTSPLMLNIMALAYRDRPANALTISGDVAERRRRLFDAYLVEVLARRQAPRARYTADKIINGLKVLAATSIQMNTGTAVRKPASESWAKILPPRTAYLIGALMMPATSLGFLSATIFGLARKDLTAALIVGTVAALVHLMVVDGTIAPARPPHFGSVRAAVATGAALVCGVALGVSTIIAANAVPRYLMGLLVMAVASLTIYLFYMEIDASSIPRDPQLVRRRRWLGIVPFAAFGVAIVFGAPVVGLSIGMIGALLVGLAVGFLLFGVAGTFLQTQFVPLWYAIGGDPWPWRRNFWRFAVDRSILARTEGEFGFIHILVRDHLAGRDADALAQLLRQRSAELVGPPAPAGRRSGKARRGT